MSGGRNPFSAEDDSYLVKYIATYNPMVSGRSGNALYQRLCENADRKWPWCARHPWQSWRDRYYKNSNAFDKRIKRYIKKHNLPETLKKLDVGEFMRRKRGRESKGTVEEENEDGRGGNSRAHKRKRPPDEDDEDERKVRIKQEPVDDTRVASQGQLGARREGGQPKQLAVRTQREDTTTVVKKEKLSQAIGAKAVVEESSMSDEGERDGNEGEDEGEGDEGEDEDEDEEEGQRFQPPGSDDYARDIFQSVPPIVTEDVPDSETESSEEVDSESQKDELDPTQPVSSGKDPPQNDEPPLYPDLTTLPSPHLRQQEQSQLASNHRTSTKAPSSPPTRQRPRSSPQPIASTSRVQLSPSHRLPRGSSLLQDTRPKRKVSRDDDFFASVPPTPTSSTSSMPLLVKRKPPQLVEGPFRNAFAGAPRGGDKSDDSSDEGGKQPTWPPVRKKKDSASQSPRKEQPESKATHKEATSNRSHKDTSKPRQKSREPAEQVMLEHTQVLTRRVSLPSRPSSSIPQSQRRNGDLTGQEQSKAAFVAAQRVVSRDRTSAEWVRKTRGEMPGTTPGHQTEIWKPQRASSSSTVLTRKSESGHREDDTRTPPLQTSSRVVTLAGPPQRRSSSLRHEAKLAEHALPTDSFTPGNPFKAPPEPAGASRRNGGVKPPSIFERRHTIDYNSEGTNSTVHLDLRSGSVRSRQSLPARVHIPTATSTPESTSHPSLLPIPIAAEDRFKVEYLGMSAAVSMISKRFSVAEEVVWRGWEKTKSISKTEEYCKRLAELNAKSEAMVLNEMRKSGIISEETPGRVSRSTAGSPRSRRSSGRRTLKIKPVADDDDVMSEYTPPFSTRAAQFTRLAKQGRKDEALTREWRRASFGGGSFPLRQRDPEYSSPARKTDVGLGGDIPGPSGTSPPATRSPTTSGENAEDARHDELEGLDEEAFLTATAENAEALREIERGVDPDLMMEWAAGVLGHLRDRASQRPQN